MIPSNKKIIFTEEFFLRILGRGIINKFKSIEECERELERKMREESAIIENPKEKYRGQKWCIIEIAGDLAKIPIVEEGEFVTAITIAWPTSDPMCKNAFYSKR